MYHFNYFLVPVFLLASLNFVHLEQVGLSEEVLARKINAVGCNLLHGLYEKADHDDNILVSPVNAYTALSLLYLGSDNETFKKLGAILKISDFQHSNEVHERLHDIISKLSTKSQDAPNKFYETILSNGIFVNDDYPIKDSYVQLAKKYYDAMAKNVDFRGHSQESTDGVNDWISTITKGRIAKFYEKPLSVDTTAVLTSALYFNAKWKEVFPEEDTQNEKFNTGSGEIEVPMMNAQRELYYVNDDALHYDSVSLPYSGREYEMTIYLQHAHHGGHHGSLAHLFHKLAEKKFVASTARRALVHIKMPRMKFVWKKSVMEALNLGNIFNMAQLAEMTSARNVTISDMLHATELEVDEKGTIATAATGIDIVLTSAVEHLHSDPIMFHVDRPFLMTITHKPTQTILFAGIIRKPIE